MKSRIKREDIIDKLRWVNGAIMLFGIAMILSVTARTLILMEILTVPAIVHSVIRAFEVIFIVYFIASVIIRITARKAVRLFTYKSDYETKLLISKLYTIAIYFIGLFFVLGYLGVTLDNLALVAGFMATAIALALRDVILSYLVWFVLLVKKPFRIGDYIQIGDDRGFVQHIGTFYVLLDDTPDERSDYVKVPNRIFWEKTINNYGKVRYHEKIVLKLNTDMSQLSKIDFEKITNEADRIVDVIRIYFDSNNDNVFLRLEYYVDVRKRYEAKTEVLKILFKMIGKKK